MQADMSDDERFRAMADGYEGVVGLVIRHEAALAAQKLPTRERAWLRTSVLNAYVFLLTYLQHVHDSEGDALQVRLPRGRVRLCTRPVQR